MKIAILVPNFPSAKRFGGFEIASDNLANYLTKAGHEVHVLTTLTTLDKGLPKESTREGFYVHRFFRSKIRIFGGILYLINISRYLKKIKPDVIHIQSFGIENTPSRVTDSDDDAAQFLQQLGTVGTHVAKPLHDYPRSLNGHTQVLEGIASGKHHSAAGGLPTAQASANLDGLAGNHSRHRIAFGHAVGIHDPGHGLGVGVDIGGRNVGLRADQHDDLAGETPGQAF